MDADVLIPVSAEMGPQRLRLLTWVAGRWIKAGYRPTLSPGPAGEWCKARALAATIGSSRTDVVVAADADCWVDSEAVSASISAAADGAAWSVPHGRVLRLTAAATASVLAGGEIDLADGQPLDRDPYVGVAGGGVLVVRRDVALDCPMDGRFVGWGGEDHSWGYALGTLHGDPHRPNPDVEHGEPLFHLWHDPPHKATMFGSVENRDRRARYWEAMVTRDADTMRRLVEEGRVWPKPDSCSDTKDSSSSSNPAAC